MEASEQVLTAEGGLQGDLANSCPITSAEMARQEMTKYFNTETLSILFRLFHCKL